MNLWPEGLQDHGLITAVPRFTNALVCKQFVSQPEAFGFVCKFYIRWQTWWGPLSHINRNLVIFCIGDREWMAAGGWVPSLHPTRRCELYITSCPSSHGKHSSELSNYYHQQDSARPPACQQFLDSLLEKTGTALKQQTESLQFREVRWVRFQTP